MIGTWTFLSRNCSPNNSQHPQMPQKCPLFRFSSPHWCHCKPLPLIISARKGELQCLSKIEPNPLGISRHFFTQNILTFISKNPNTYAQKKQAGEGRPWKGICSEEVETFFAICIYLGVLRSPRIEDYWERSGVGPSHVIKTYMWHERYQQIKRYLHICDLNGENGAGYFLKKWSLC